jgi:hypothetical protein
VGLNIREVKTDTCLPTGGGADGQQPIGVLKGEQVGKYIQRPVNSGEDKKQALTGLSSVFSDELAAARGCHGLCRRRYVGSVPVGELDADVVPILALQHRPPHLSGSGVWSLANGVYVGADGARIRPDRMVRIWRRRPDDEPMRIKIELNTKFDKPIMCKFTPRSTA